MAVLNDDLPPQLNSRAWLRGLAGFALSLVIAGIAVAVLARAIKKLDIAHAVSIAQATDPKLIGLALALIALSYGGLIFYDLFALRTIGRKDIPFRAAAVGSFTSYPIAHGIGAVALISPLVRYRVYAPYKLGALDIAKISFLTGLTFWLGNLTALGLSLMIDPDAFGWVEYWPPTLNRLVAAALLCGILAFVIWSWPGRRSERWRLRLPSGPTVLLQILIGLFDLSTAALAMYVLIPAELGIDVARLMAVFIAATLLGFASHAPAGIGLFDATIMLGLGGDDQDQLLAALLMFRILYHLIPFILSLTLFGGIELCRSWRGSRTVRPASSASAPPCRQ
ncbi:lysylphosphatidylglycerol synthase transmembrane domain-containing protein [Bradyrhizobium sp. USDA 4353]